MTGELKVDPVALDLAARGIDDTIADLNGMGMLSEGGTGRGLGALTLTGLEAGHHGVAGALADFCDRWGWGVRGLVADANHAAESLGLSAGLYAHEDDLVKTRVGLAAKSFVVDPQGSSDNASWSDAVDDARETWHDAAEDLAGTERVRMTDPWGYYRDEAGRAADGVLGGGEG